MASDDYRIETDSPAGPELMFWAIVGLEGMSQPSVYRLRVLSTNEAISHKDILGHAFDLVIEFEDGDGSRHKRHCRGHAVRFSRRGVQGRYFEYSIELRSWFWLLDKRTNARIFQGKNVLEVVDATIDDSPISGLKNINKDGIVGQPDKRPYCVQFQETDFRFLSRLLEDEGIYYWFDAHDAPDAMFLSNASDVAHSPLPVTQDLHQVGAGRQTARFNEFGRWTGSARLGSGRHVSHDSDFKAIRRKLAGSSADVAEHELGDLEVFEFPGGHLREADADKRSRMRMEELAARRHLYWAATSWPDVAVGRRTRLHSIYSADEIDDEHMIVSCLMHASHPGYEGTDTSAPLDLEKILLDLIQDDRVNDEQRDEWIEAIRASDVFVRPYWGAHAFFFTSVPVKVPFRPPRTTPRVRMPGPQTAIVVGPDGDEHHVDKFGRVKVHFPWDRYDESNEKSTCWVRVSQPWAGKGWGGYFAPRIGQEVIVDFLNGDPDRPVIMGRVYNDDQPIPYDQPTYSGFKTRSTPNGGPTNFNELRFRDDKDKEQVFIHAERRMDVRVKRNKYETVQGTSQTLIGGGYVLTVGGANDWKIGDALFHSTGAKYDCGIGANLTLGVEGDLFEIVKGKTEINATKITLEAKEAIVLKVGANFVKVDPSGVTIQGSMVKINSGGGAGGTSSPDIEEPLSAAQADTGEPGYVDKLPKGGGGGGRNKRTLNSQHALPYAQTKLANGDIRLGNGLIVKSDPTDPTFQDKALEHLATIASTEQGSATLNGIDQSGKEVTVRPQDPAHPFNQTDANNYDDAAPKGKTYWVDNAGNKHEYDGTGKGTGSDIYWKPDDGKTMANGEPRPSDVSLHHELSHAQQHANGIASTETAAPPDNTIAKTKDEAQTIKEDNAYRKERGVPPRANHSSL